MSDDMGTSLAVDIRARADLGSAEIREMERIFLRSYRGGDTEWFRSCLDSLSVIAVGRVGGEVVGFGASGARRLDLGPIGERMVYDGGFACVDPDRRVRGAGARLATAPLEWMRADPETPSFEVHALTISNPVMLHISLSYESVVEQDTGWPTGTPAEIVETLRSPTSTQREVGAIFAAASGASSFDGDHWVMHHEAGHGDAGVSSRGLDPVFDVLFCHVDAVAGDKFLLLGWPRGSKPPAVWFQ